MDVLICIPDVVSMLAFGAAGVLAIRGWPGGTKAYMPRWSLGSAFMLYAFIGFSNVLEHSGITAYLDGFEDYAELLFVPLLVLGLFAAEAQARLSERSQSAILLQQQNDLLMNIVDTSPIGIMIVAPGGQVIFANDPARNMLGIEENPDSITLKHPNWTLTDADGRPTRLDDLVGDTPISGARRILTWPDGRRQQFIFSVTPMNDATATLGGAVMAVEAVTGA